MSSVAGHTFDLAGRCTTLQGDGVCPVRWIDIRHCDASYVGDTGIAHRGVLSQREATEIMEAAEAESARCHDATMGRSSVVDIDAADEPAGYGAYLAPLSSDVTVEF